MRTGRRTQPGIRGVNSVTCSRKCSRQYVRLGKVDEKRKKEEAHKKRLEKLKKLGIINQKV